MTGYGRTGQDRWFNNVSAAENFLRQSGFLKKDGKWVSPQATAGLAEDNGRIKVFIRQKWFQQERKV